MVLPLVADTTIKRLLLRNWQTVVSSEIEFPDAGLVVIRGSNRTDPSKIDSVGSGKSALGEALSRALLDVTGRYALFGHYSRFDQGDTLVQVECLHKGQTLVVDHGFRAPEVSKTGESLRFSYAGQQVWRDKIRNTRTDLAALLGVSPNLATWTVHIDGDRLRFGDASQRMSVDLLMEALNQPSWNEPQAKIQATLAQFKTDVSVATHALSAAQTQLSVIKADVDTTRQSLARAQQNYATARQRWESTKAAAVQALALAQRYVDDADLTLAELAQRIKKATETTAADEHMLETAGYQVGDEVDKLTAQLSTARLESHKANHEQQTLALKLEDLQTAKTCPTCKRPWEHTARDPLQIDQVRTSLAAAVQTAGTRAAAVNKLSEQLADKRKEAQDLRARLVSLRQAANVQDLSRQYETLTSDRRRLLQRVSLAEQALAVASQEPKASEVDHLTTLLSEREQKLASAQAAVNAAEQDQHLATDAVNVAEYWRRGFGPNGIPNLVLKDALAPLNRTAERIAQTLSGQTLRVNYAASRDLANSNTRAELVVTITNAQGATRLGGSSKGESGLIDLILAETLAEVGQVARRIGYRFYDEVLANQDESVRRNVLAYLKSAAQRHGILIFIVSHAPEASQYADYTLIAEKTKQGTSYAWG